MWVEFVVPKHVDNLLHRHAPDDNVAQGEAERKIEDRSQAGVDAIELFSSAFEKRRDRRVAVPHFADIHDLRINHLRIDLVKPFVPSAPELARGIGKRIQAESIQLRYLYPPHRILRQVETKLRIIALTS